MSLIVLLENLLIGPLKLVFEILFVVAHRLLGKNPGLAIIALSLIMNVMVLPLYRRADAMQEESRDVEEKLRDGSAHIKKTFSGDERMMILQTYYRQNNYKPTDVLNGSVSLLLEIPFFMAAYQFLSHLAMLKGVSFGPIADLGAPDELLVIGGLTINLLPIVMTLVNVVSCSIYLKGFPLKTKLQLYGMAGFFLVFLYTSPAGLVFYWTLNNLFSLGKNIFCRVKHAGKIGMVLLAAAGVALVSFGGFLYPSGSFKRKVLIVGVGMLLMLPAVWQMMKGRFTPGRDRKQPEPNRKLFLLGSVFLTILTGMLIPSTYIAASAQEFVDPSYYHNPMLYILVTTCLSAGTFLVWLRVFYWLANDKGKVLFGRAVWILSGVMLVNYMFFGTNLGILYSNLQYSDGISFSSREELMNLLTIAAVSLVLLTVVCKKERVAVTALLTASIALGGMTVLNTASIHNQTKSISDLVQRAEENKPRLTLSKTEKNTVIIMLDRAMGQMIPYIFNEKPELQEKFDGFTYYDNTISFGSYTVFGAPVLYGGYEYTPVEMNRRDQETLVDKHNEALKVLPILFSGNGYTATLINPVYANYEWLPDLSVFDEYPQISAYITNGVYVDDTQKQAAIDTNYRNFFCFSMMKCMPLMLQRSIYCEGSYNQAPSDSAVFTSQTKYSTSVAEGFYPTFMDEYAALSNLSAMTDFTESPQGTFTFLSNATTHDPMILQAPEYVPAAKVDNTSYDAANKDRFTVNGRTLTINTPEQMAHYHINMAAMLRMADWFDYLRANGVYDNTRIILTSDHGFGMGMSEHMLLDTGYGYEYDVSAFDALLMVKDFDSHEFTTSHEFMTNADVPSLAMMDLIQDPVNPFTGKKIDSSEKFAHPQYLTRSQDWGTGPHKGNTFLPSTWVSVTGDPKDSSNWTFFDTEMVLAEHADP